MKPLALLAVLASILSTSCATSTTAPAAQAKPEPKPVIVGEATREQIEADPEWAMAEAESQPDPEICKALASVPPGAEVTVFLGTWCGDSRREVPRFWKALDFAGGTDLPFTIHYIGVDRQKKEPSAPVTNNNILYVPTFIVYREGREVGRIVEESPHGIEKDLLSLLTGQAQGLITTRTDLMSTP
ncbi:MAG TPA: thioredoxin family protein [Thermoanaerobaculia bacterium]|nr:thioredoxin family protein [Thermoanaerobaculia bacterium]